ncbi:phage tail sheath subtilisin-like domain-containing protein [Desulfocurvus vexinensis]|uniref:phage tail sheath subtilisin-like domain-containing protein n=1 Tax=Desulfocurvus vexinensis TaxID=399548 RepID=UPI00048F8B8A|nr:phage tail sheath subtilisin-like domain-containing protein [Desulfocurvus vexinensis]
MAEQFLHGIEVLEIDDGTRPIQTVKSSVIGVVGTAPQADAAKFPINHPVLITGSPRQAATLGAAGTLKDALDGIFDQCGAMVVVVRVEEGADAAATRSNVIGDAATMTGVHAFLGAQSEVKVTPRILCAPGFTGDRPDDAANPVVAELQGIAEKLRAVVIADGPNSSDTEAIAYREDWGSDRIYIVEPFVKVWDTTTNAVVVQPASARVAGKLAWMDNTRGFWWSPSNQVLNGIVGTARPVQFNLSDSNTAANLLNENEVTTIVHRDGYRLWGNRTTATDPQWAFLSVRRTADMIYESIEEAFLWAMDRPLSANLVLDIQESVNAYLRHLKAQGAILGGKCWLDEELNSKESLMAGKLYMDFDIEPPAPMERLTFRAHRENGYYEELVDHVLTATPQEEKE